MKLCKEMVDAMGGQDSDHYRQFQVGGGWGAWPGPNQARERESRVGACWGQCALSVTTSHPHPTPTALLQPHPMAQTYCCEAYNILRKSANLLLSLFHLMAGASIPDIQSDPEKAMLKLQASVCTCAALPRSAAWLGQAGRLRRGGVEWGCHLSLSKRWTTRPDRP